MSETLARLQAALMGKPDKIPNGFKTTEQWAKEWKLSEPRTRFLLGRAVAKDLYEMQKFRVPSAGTIKAMPFYRER